MYLRRVMSLPFRYRSKDDNMLHRELRLLYTCAASGLHLDSERHDGKTFVRLRSSVT